jgi:hypothetical protein
MSKKRKYVEVFKEGPTDLKKCTPIRTKLVAMNQQIYLSTLPVERVIMSLGVIAEQNDLKVHFCKKISLTGWDLHISYEITDMIDCLELLERSVMEN